MERLQYSRRGALRLVGTALVGGFAECGGSNSTTHSAPEANFDWEYTPDGENDYGVVMITHSGTKKLLDPDGDAIDPRSLFIRGDGLTGAPSMDYDTSEVGAWSPEGEATGEGGGSSSGCSTSSPGMKTEPVRRPYGRKRNISVSVKTILSRIPFRGQSRYIVRRLPQDCRS